MYISIDLGGTNTRVAASKDLKKFEAIEKFKTEKGFEPEMAAIFDAIQKVAQGEEIQGISLGVPGSIDKEAKLIKSGPNILGFSGKRFGEVFSPHYPAEIVLIENDAALAGIGEAVYGAGKDFDNVAYITLSTGVGGSHISKGEIAANLGNSEPGHMIIVGGGRFHEPCGQYGCIEGYLSGVAFEAIYGESPVTCTNQKYWDDYAEKLALGVNNIVAMWLPEVIVFGGSMSLKFEDYFKKPLIEKLVTMSFVKKRMPELKLLELGDNAGLMGGLEVLSRSGL